MCICSIITTTIRYVYMCCLVEHYNNNNKVCVYVLTLVEHYNNNNKVCVYVLPCGAL